MPFSVSFNAANAFATLSRLIDEIDGYLDDIKDLGGKILQSPWIKDGYKYLEFMDPLGNQVELITSIHK